MITDAAAHIIPRRSAEGHPFCEILHTWKEDGVELYALSRVRWSIDNTPYARSAAVAAFLERRRRNG